MGAAKRASLGAVKDAACAPGDTIIADTSATTHRDVAPEPEKENVSDYSVVVDLDQRAVFAFWFEPCPSLLNCVHSALPITKMDANGVYFEAKRKEFGTDKYVVGGVDRITGYVNADDMTTFSNGSSMHMNWDLHCKPTRPLF